MAQKTPRRRRTPPAERPGPVPIYHDRVRMNISMDRTLMERVRTCAVDAGMPIGQWIGGILLAEFERQDRRQADEARKIAEAAEKNAEAAKKEH